MNIQECKNIEEYLQMCAVESVDSLTKEQLLAWVKAGKTDVDTENSLWTVENGSFGFFPDENKAILLIRQAVKEGKSFYCSFIANESYGPNDRADNGEHEHFMMEVD